MKIKITESNRSAIDAALKESNGRATAHAFNFASDVFAVAKSAEARLDGLGIPKAARKGATAAARSGSNLPSAYKYARTVTILALTRTSTGWFLTNVSTLETFDRSEGKTRITLTAAQDEIAVENLRRGYNVAGVAAP